MKKLVVFDFNRTLFDPDQGRLIDGALELLEKLKTAGHFLILLGKAPRGRGELIKELGIEKYFNKIILKDEKTIEDFKTAKKLVPPDSYAYAVGDRIKKEILLANLAGFKTIWFKNGRYAVEEPSTEDEQPWMTINSLNELYNLVS
jgi:putative hydrolase of the HAD superfamily